jgi:hypothetical protein
MHIQSGFDQEPMESLVPYPNLKPQFGSYGVGDGVGVVAHEWFGLGLDHDAGEGFGSAVADDDAA